jgi:hypothetical protein
MAVMWMTLVGAVMST